MQKGKILTSIVLMFLFTTFLLVLVMGAAKFTVTFDSPANNSYSNTARPDFNVTVEGTNQSYNVTLLINGIPNGSINLVNGTLTRNITTVSTLADGVYVWSFNVTNGSFSNVSVARSINRTFTVDTTLPVVSFQGNNPANNANLSKNNLFVNVTITETNFKNMSFYLYDATGVVNETRFNISTQTLNLTGLSDGWYYYNVTVRDNASWKGNSGQRNITIDTTTPKINFFGGEANNSNVSKTRLFMNLTITEVTVVNVTYKLTNSSGVVINTTIIKALNRTFLNMSFNGGNIPDDTYTYNVTITDATGHVNVTENRIVHIDNRAPAIVFQGETPIPNLNLSTTSFVVNVSIYDVYFKNMSFFLYNASGVISEVRFNTSTQYYNFSSLSQGQYYYNVTAKDVYNRANNSGQRNITLDRSAPSVTPSATPATVNGGETVTLSCTATDTYDPAVAKTYSVKKPDTDVYTTITSLSYTDTAALAGTYTFKCLGTDDAGNAASATTTFTVSTPSGSSSSSSSSGSSGSSSAPAADTTTDEIDTDAEVIRGAPEVDTASDLSDEGTWEEVGEVSLTGVEVGNEYTFTFVDSLGLEEEHRLTILDVDQDAQTVNLLFSSEAVEVTVGLGETTTVDLDQDGADDVEVTLNAISEEGLADLTLKKLGTGWTTEEKGGSLLALWIVLGLVVIAGLVIWLFTRNRD
ncbi:MAG: hypothetical protein Q8Q35_01170 [Nanoarchaeota archaeon]|nr:hypothetical protein [Nanoarchaeota archaeon]